MAERSDITVDWGIFDRTSPRLVTVGSPSTALVIQDLVDTLRSNTLPAGEADDSLDNMDDDLILEAEGKVPVQPTLQSGIIATLQNAKLLFAARVGPDTILCTITRGDLVSFLSDSGSHTGGDSGTVVIDSAASWITYGIEANGEFTVENITDGSSATVTAVDSGIQITTDGLTGGSDNTFQAGDTILVSGFATSPIEPSAFTTVSYAASVAPSITAIDNINTKVNDIHGQVEREIYIDQDEPVNGIGYQQSPYDNWSDAVDDAESRGLLNLVIKSDATVDRQIRNFSIRGITFPTLDMDGQDMDGTTVSAMNITGVQLGAMLAQDIGMASVSGEILAQRVAIAGTYLVRGGSFSILTTVAPLIPGQPWELDLGLADTASVVGIADISGGMSVANMDQPGDTVHIHFNSGVLTIDATCTDGNIVVTGLAEVIDNSTGTTVDISAVVNIAVIGGAPWDALTVDHTIVGTFGEKVGQKLLTFAKWIAVRGGSGK